MFHVMSHVLPEVLLEVWSPIDKMILDKMVVLRVWMDPIYRLVCCLL